LYRIFPQSVNVIFDQKDRGCCDSSSIIRILEVWQMPKLQIAPLDRLMDGMDRPGILVLENRITSAIITIFYACAAHINFEWIGA